jgi:4-amino-4-deoxy-L-arabinose transferase-like glycosyltransferase
MPLSNKTRTWLTLLCLAAVCALLFGYRLAGTPFRGLYDDVDRALIARTMADSGDWISPTYHYHHLTTKPPLMYWVAGLLYDVLGRRDELPAALASALSSGLVVMICFGIGAMLWGWRTGVLSALLLASSYLFLAMARQPLLDTVMMVGFMLAVVSLLRLGFATPTRPDRWWGFVALGLGLATMTKGPVVVPIFVLAAIPLWLGRPRCLPDGHQWKLMLVIFVAVVLPWHLILAAVSPNAWAVWKRELLGRFDSVPTAYPWTRKPWWFYLTDLGHFLPWLPLLPAGIVHAFRHRHERRFQVLLWWALGGLAFFSLASATKRSYYLLPLYPALAILCGAMVDAVLVKGARGGSPRGGRLTPSAETPETARASALDPAAADVPDKLFAGGAYVIALLATFLGLVALAAPLRFDVRPAWLFFIAGMVAAFLGGWALQLLHTRRAPASLIKSGPAILLLLLLYVGHIVPPLNAYISGKPFYIEAAPLVGDASELAVFHAQRSLTAFYMNRLVRKPWTAREVRQAVTGGEEGFVVADPAYAEQIEGLQPVLVRWLRSPFGQTRRLGLYRLPGPGNR